MRFVVLGPVCAGVLLASLGCVDGSDLPMSPTVSAATPVAAAVPGVAGAGSALLKLTKTCDAIDHCTVITSTSGPIPVGSDVNYSGPLLEARTTSRIVVTTPGDDTAMGYCSVSYRTGEGICTITHGTGALEGLQANLKVSSDFESDPAGVFTWEGRYQFTR